MQLRKTPYHKKNTFKTIALTLLTLAAGAISLGISWVAIQEHNRLLKKYKAKDSEPTVDNFLIRNVGIVSQQNSECSDLTPYASNEVCYLFNADRKGHTKRPLTEFVACTNSCSKDKATILDNQIAAGISRTYQLPKNANISLVSSDDNKYSARAVYARSKL
ncbi:MAG TPA: hypothetical protein VLG38_02665 [Gammaproteobacteria bacterium]|nr:hypothetical protein [Gammaproteobacteria bacterium]